MTHHTERAAKLLKAADAAAAKANMFAEDRLHSDDAAAWIERSQLFARMAHAHATLALALGE